MCKFNLLYIKATQWSKSVREDLRGDTNFISIVIVLGIVVAIAVFFSTGANKLVADMWTKITTNVNGLG